MATNIESRNDTSNMPGRRPSFSRSIGQSLSAAFGKKDGYYFEIEFLTDTASYHIGEKKQILVGYAEIGRSSNSTVRYKGEGIEKLVSGTHISITRTDGKWTLEHLSKTNRTIINGGERTIRPEDSFKRYVLQDGDTVQLAKGGPMFRFTVPAENSIQSFRSKSRGTTFIRNIVSQALAPHKTKIKWLSTILGVLTVLFTAYFVLSTKKINEQSRLISRLQQQFEENATISDSIYTVQRDTVIINNTTTVIQEDRSMLTLAQQQNLKSDVYKLFFDSVVFTGPDMHINIPVGGTGSGFLLSDGRFVTARHCVELWICTPQMILGNNEETMQARLPLLCYASMYDFCKLKSYFRAVSSSGQVFHFSSDQFKCDHSADIKIPIPDETGAPLVAEDGTPVFFYAPSDTKLGLDWAYTTNTNGKIGNIEADSDLSTSLQTGRKLLVIGYPLGYTGDSNEPISNDQPYILDPPYSHGCFVYSSGADHGNSGGPIFANRNGKLVAVGLVSQGGTSHNLAIPMKNVR